MLSTFLSYLKQLVQVYPVPARAIHIEFLTAAFSSNKHPILAMAASIPAVGEFALQPCVERCLDWSLVQNDVAYQLAQVIEFAKLPDKISAQAAAYAGSGQPYGYSIYSFRAPFAQHPGVAATSLLDLLTWAESETVPIVTYNMLGFFYPFCQNMLQWLNLPTDKLVSMDLYDPGVLVKAAMTNTPPNPGESWAAFASRMASVRCTQKHNLAAAAQLCGVSLQSEALLAVSYRALPYNVRLCQLLLDRWRDL